MGVVEPDGLRAAFFYGVTLGHAEIPQRIPYAREPRKRPVVLSTDEVVRFPHPMPGWRDISPEPGRGCGIEIAGVSC